jgi:hypothetical protein
MSVGTRSEVIQSKLAKVTHTLTRQIAIPSLVRVQNSDLWGLGVIPSTGSGEALGNEGTVQNWWATEVGKYINRQRCASSPGTGVLTNRHVWVRESALMR